MSKVKLVCPFHVATALTNINRLKGQVDLLITVSDARSLSATDLSKDLISSFQKSGSKILNLISKSDLSDLKLPNAFNFKEQKSRNQILKLIRKTLEIDKYQAQGYKPHLQVLIAGLPNTGKSTLINLLKGKKVAISENLPGKTKKISKFPIGDNIWIYDTPGIFMPRNSKGELANKLFLINSVPTTLQEKSTILEKAYGYLYQNYFNDLSTLLNREPPEDYYLFLEELSKKYQFKIHEDKWDLDRAESKFLNILWLGQIKLSWDKDD